MRQDLFRSPPPGFRRAVCGNQSSERPSRTFTGNWKYTPMNSAVRSTIFFCLGLNSPKRLNIDHAPPLVGPDRLAVQILAEGLARLRVFVQPLAGLGFAQLRVQRQQLRKLRRQRRVVIVLAEHPMQTAKTQMNADTTVNHAITPD